MAAAIGWGALAASSLVIGALLAFARDWSGRQTGTVLAFGAGALISAVSFELVEEGTQVAGLSWVALGLAIGAVTYFAADGAVSNRGKHGGRGGRAGPRTRSGRAAAAHRGPAPRWRSAPSSTGSPSRWCSASDSRRGRGSASA